MNHPTDAYDKFEEISALVKQTKMRFNDPNTDEVVNAPSVTNRDHEIESKHLLMRKNLLNGVTANVSKEDK
jgi:hypothetical protein